MAQGVKTFDEIYEIYSSLHRDSGFYRLDSTEIKIARDREFRHKRPRAITLLFPDKKMKWRVEQSYFNCLTEKYDFLPKPIHIITFIKDYSITQLCCRGSLWMSVYRTYDFKF